MQHGDPVADGGDQFVVRGQHVLVAVLVAAVGRQREQVQEEPGPPVGAGPFDLHLAGRHRVEQRLAQALHPEFRGVRHVPGKFKKIRIMPNVVACLLSYHLERGRGDVDDPARFDP